MFKRLADRCCQCGCVDFAYMVKCCLALVVIAFYIYGAVKCHMNVYYCPNCLEASIIDKFISVEILELLDEKCI